MKDFSYGCFVLIGPGLLGQSRKAGRVFHTAWDELRRDDEQASGFLDGIQIGDACKLVDAVARGVIVGHAGNNLLGLVGSKAQNDSAFHQEMSSILRKARPSVNSQIFVRLPPGAGYDYRA